MSKMTEEDKKLITELLGKLVEIMGHVNALEITFSRLKNEAEELLRKLLKPNDKG